MSPGILRRWAFGLLWATLFYNVVEGVVALWAGFEARSLVLVAFGADSYLEVMAAAAVIWRLSFADPEAGERAEARVLPFIGWTFVVLAAAVIFQSAISLAGRDAASESTAGIVLLIASLVTMPALAVAKLWVAARSQLAVLAAEAKETVACGYLSVTALAGLICTAAFGWWWLDAAAALLMVPWLVKEGLERIRGDACFDNMTVCWCRKCWFGLRACTDAGLAGR